MVLGGIFEQETRNAQTKVPFLGDLPYLGRLFRKDVKSDNKRELLILLHLELLMTVFQEIINIF